VVRFILCGPNSCLEPVTGKPHEMGSLATTGSATAAPGGVVPALDAARRGPHTDARTGQNGRHPETRRQRATQRPKPPGWQRPWATHRPKPLGGQRPPAHQRPREAANTAPAPQAHPHQSIFARAMPNIELMRPISDGRAYWNRPRGGIGRKRRRSVKNRAAQCPSWSSTITSAANS